MRRDRILLATSGSLSLARALSLSLSLSLSPGTVRACVFFCAVFFVLLVLRVLRFCVVCLFRFRSFSLCLSGVCVCVCVCVLLVYVCVCVYCCSSQLSALSSPLSALRSSLFALRSLSLVARDDERQDGLSHGAVEKTQVRVHTHCIFFLSAHTHCFK